MPFAMGSTIFLVRLGSCVRACGRSGVSWVGGVGGGDGGGRGDDVDTEEEESDGSDGLLYTSQSRTVMVFFFSLRALEAAAATTTRFGEKVPARELSEKLETGLGKERAREWCVG